MAKKTITEIVIKTTDGGSFKIVGKEAEKLAKKLDKTGRSAQNTDRKMKGLTQQSSNSTKEFSKMATMQGGLVQVYATIAAQVFALSAAFMFLKDAMETRNLIEGQLAFGSVTGTAYKTLTTNIQAAAGGMLQFKEAAQAAAIGTAGGLSASQLTRLGEAAKNTSLALGRDLTDSFNRLVRGVTKAEPELLDELGIILRLEPALKNYAASIGKSVSALNQFEKSQAVASEVLGQAESKFGMMSILMDDSAFALQQFQKSFDDLMNSLKKNIGDFAGTVLPFFTENIMALVGAMGLFLVPILKSLLPDFEAMKIAKRAQAQDHIDNMDLEIAKMKQLKAEQQQLREGQNKLRATAGPALDAQAEKMGVSGGVRGKARMIAHYEKQTTQLINKEIKKRTGALAAASPKDVAILKTKYENMNAATASFGAKTRAQFGMMGTYFNMTVSRMKSVWSRSMLIMTRIGQGFATAMNWAFKLMGWASVILLIYEGIKALMQWKEGVDDAREAERKYFDEVKDNYADIADELERMRKAQTRGFVSGETYIEQVGKSIQSLDVPDLVKQYNDLLVAQPDPGDEVGMEKWSAAMNNVKGAVTAFGNVMTGLDKEGLVKRLVDDMDAGIPVTDDATKAVVKYTNTWANQAMFITQAAERNKTLARSIQEVSTAAGSEQFGQVLDDMYADYKAGLNMPSMLELVLQQESSQIDAKLEEIKKNKAEWDEWWAWMQDPNGGYPSGPHGGQPSDSWKAYVSADETKPGGKESDHWAGFRWANAHYRKEYLAFKNRDALLTADLVRLEENRTEASEKNFEIEKANKETLDKMDRMWEIQTDLNTIQAVNLQLKKDALEYEGRLMSHSDTITKNHRERLKIRQAENNLLQAETHLDDLNFRAELQGIGKEQMDAARAAYAANDGKGDWKALYKAGFDTKEKRALARSIILAEKDVDIGEAKVKVTKEQVAESIVLNNITWETTKANFENVMASKEIARNETLVKHVMAATVGYAQERLALYMENELRLSKADLLLDKAVQAEKTLLDYTKKRVDENGKELNHNLEQALKYDEKRKQAIEDYLKAMKDITYEMYKQSAQARMDKMESGTSKGKTGAESRFGKRGFMGYASGAWGSAFGPDAAYKKERGEMGYATDDELVEGEFIKAVQREKSSMVEDFVRSKGGPDSVTATELKEFTDNLEVGNDRMVELRGEAAGLPKALREASFEAKNFAIELELAESIENTLTNGFVSMFQALVDGTQSFSDAMKGLMKQVLADLAAAYLKAAALKFMMSMGLPGAGELPARYGGVLSKSGKSFGYGGVAHGPNSGYQATLHGTEAVVPLGNDRSIPVELSGGTGSNIVNVTISMNGQGQAQSQVSGDGLQGLGRSVGNLVQAHLQQEMRPGGLLNPQGSRGRQ